MGITLYLLNKKGLRVLECIVENKDYLNLIDQVIVAKDVGNNEDCYKEITLLATKYKIPFHERTSQFSDLSDYSVAIGWRWLINNANKLIVLHDSVLPKYRGFAPLVNMLINKEPFIGATMIMANKEMDAGPLMFQQKVRVKYPIKVKVAIDKMADIYVNLIEMLLNKLIKNEKIALENQNDDDATYSIWRDEEDYFIDWSDKAEDIARFVDSVGFPYKGAMAYLQTKDEVVIIKDAVPIEIKFEINAPGKVFKIEKGLPLVLCGEGVLKIKTMVNSKGEPIYISKLRQRFL